MGDWILGRSPEMVRYGDFVAGTDFPNELGTDGDFGTWVGNVPNNWTELVAGDGAIEEVGPGEFAGGAGTGAANISSSQSVAGSHLARLIYDNNFITLTSGNYNLSLSYWQNAGSADGTIFVGNAQRALTASGKHSFGNINPVDNDGGVTIGIASTVSALDVTFDNISVRSTGPWTYIEDWEIYTDDKAVFTATTTNSRKLSQVLDTAVGDLYQILVTVSGIDLDAANARLVVLLDGATAGYITKNDSYTLFVRAGVTPSAGLQFLVENDTVGDTVTIDDVSCKLAVSGQTTNEEEIIVTGPLTTGEGEDIRTGPNDIYIKSGTTNSGRHYWISIETHEYPPGVFTFFHLFWLDGVWIIGPELEVATEDRWESEAATTSYSPLDFDFNPLGTFTGVATANGGPFTIERRNQAKRRSRYELVG